MPWPNTVPLPPFGTSNWMRHDSCIQPADSAAVPTPTGTPFILCKHDLRKVTHIQKHLWSMNIYLNILNMQRIANTYYIHRVVVGPPNIGQEAWCEILKIGPLGSDKIFKNFPFSFRWHQGYRKKCKFCSDEHIRLQIIQICSDGVIRPRKPVTSFQGHFCEETWICGS